MRTTLNIDDDVLAAAKGLANLQHKSVCEVISALARQALRPKPKKQSAQRRAIATSARWGCCSHARIGESVARRVAGVTCLLTFDRRLVVDAVRGGKKGLHLIG